MPTHMRLVVAQAQAGQRLDSFLAQQVPALSRALAQRYLAQGRVTLHGRALPKSHPVQPGEELLLDLPDPAPLQVLPEAIPLDIVYEDRDLLVVNKPKGMVVHPAPGHSSGTLVNALLAHCGDSLSGINGVLRPGIVHRIDKDTSGLLMVAKNDLAHQSLAQQISTHSFQRAYEAVVHGNVKSDQGTVDAPIGRHPVERKRMAVVPNGRPARTHYRVLQRYQGFTHLRLRLETGRTHQIRVHMAYLGHPVAGDPVYGPKKAAPGLHGQCLHACLIGFIHPRTGAYLEFTSPLPQEFVGFLARLEPV